MCIAGFEPAISCVSSKRFPTKLYARNVVCGGPSRLIHFPLVPITTVDVEGIEPPLPLILSPALCARHWLRPQSYQHPPPVLGAHQATSSTRPGNRTPSCPLVRRMPSHLARRASSQRDSYPATRSPRMCICTLTSAQSAIPLPGTDRAINSGG
jgi:hypothetical protein